MEKKSISIRMILILMFIMIMCATVGSISFIIYSNWLSSANETFTQMAKDMNAEIVRELDDFVKVPLHINEINVNALKYDIIDLSDARERDAFFVNVLKTHSPDVYSFSLGLENGDYYGARRNNQNIPEIMHNNTQTGNYSWYYSVNDDLTAGELVLSAGKFDPRSRDWYKAAAEKKEPVFSNMYKHFVLDDLAISAAYPVYGTDGVLKGVLGTHITLTQINNFLKANVTDKKAHAVIIEKETGNLIANSLDQTNFIALNDGGVKHVNIEEIEDSSIREAYARYKHTGVMQDHIDVKTDRVATYITEYQKDGLNWLVVTTIPESIFTTGIFQSIQLTIGLTVLGLILSGLAFYKLTAMAFKPVDDLIESTAEFTNGDLSKRAIIARNDEIGKIATAFNTMAKTIDSLINELEMKVNKRTKELKESNASLEFLNYHDALTGLYNRIYFEKSLKDLDNQQNFPIGLIFGDVNGLKLTNDIFGHAAGDILLKRVSNIMKQTFREKDIIARIGGDEFAILLLNTESEEVYQLMRAVRKSFSKENIVGLKGSISLGCDVKSGPGKSTDEMLKNAEDAMYHNKTMNRKGVNAKLIENVIATLHHRSPIEKSHSENVSQLCEQIGRFIHLSPSELKRLKEAGYLHDIGKVILDDQMLNRTRKFGEDEKKTFQEHSVVGYRVLNMFDETLNLAESVLAHHEHWDGSGYPKGLKDEEIPLLARIIAIAETYDTLTNPMIGIKKSQEEAIAEIITLSGKDFDPEIVNALVGLMNPPSGKQK
ncbi:diguanylate cyclase [Acetobacterium carbinolicum]|uniref:diguanylate cyclase n=1 Tax=Acetobacterium carbinolicum TaxID=52690 RepID=UPI0039BF21A7